MTESHPTERAALAAVAQCLPSGFALEGDGLSFRGNSAGFVYPSEVPGRFELELEPFFEWDHGYVDVIPWDAVRRFDAQKDAYLAQWTALGGACQGDDWFNDYPGHLVHKILWTECTAEQVRDILEKVHELGLGLHFAEPERVTVSNLKARYGSELMVDHPKDVSDSIKLVYRGDVVARWLPSFESLFVRLPLLLAPFDRTLPQTRIQEVGAQWMATLKEALRRDGFEVEHLDVETTAEGEWWIADVGRGCTTVDAMHDGLRTLVECAKSLRETFPDSRMDPTLERFLLETTADRAGAPGAGEPVPALA